MKKIGAAKYIYYTEIAIKIEVDTGYVPIFSRLWMRNVDLCGGANVSVESWKCGVRM